MRFFSFLSHGFFFIFYYFLLTLSARHPLPFPFRVIPRSKAAVDLVNSSELLE